MPCCHGKLFLLYKLCKYFVKAFALRHQNTCKHMNIENKDSKLSLSSISQWNNQTLTFAQSLFLFIIHITQKQPIQQLVVLGIWHVYLYMVVFFLVWFAATRVLTYEYRKLQAKNQRFACVCILFLLFIVNVLILLHFSVRFVVLMFVSVVLMKTKKS